MGLAWNSRMAEVSLTGTVTPEAGQCLQWNSRRSADKVRQATSADRDRDDRHLRWSFRDILPESFTWVGEFSADGRHTWIEDERVFAVRQT